MDLPDSAIQGFEYYVAGLSAWLYIQHTIELNLKSSVKKLADNASSVHFARDI